MSGSTHTIDLDVSRALAAQQKLADGFDNIAKSGRQVVTALEPFKENIDIVGVGIEKAKNSLASLSSSTRLEMSVNSVMKLNAEFDKLNSIASRISLGLPREFDAGFKNSVVDMTQKFVLLQNVVNTLSSQLKSIPKHKFDFSSVEDYRQKLDHLGAELQALNAIKVHMNPIDYKNMKSSLEEAIEYTKQALRKVGDS